MTVRQLIDLLSKHVEANPEVLITWESTCHEIYEDSVYLSADGDLVLDGDADSYKKQIMTIKGWLRGGWLT